MILITGASRGIGKFLLQKFVGAQEQVFGTFFSTPPESAWAHLYKKVDVTSIKEVMDWTGPLIARQDKIVLINSAGTNYNAFAHKAELKKWRQVIEVNLFGTFNVIQSVLPRMRETGYGRIINFSSVVAQLAIPGTSAYAASKAALWGLTRSLAAENAKKGITINNLNLGYFQIGMISEVPEEYQKALKDKIPAGDFGDPENIYRTIQLIIENNYLNGTSLDINGGLY
jgi:acetoacetyl-CoA reductase/3-oxoacyl-[acyl-carrier protein] reductase